MVSLSSSAPVTNDTTSQPSGESVMNTILRDQWRSPSDILTILMIIGGDIVQKALAQLTGGPIVPVTFSFGWVAYAFGALMSAVGDGKIMPETDCPSSVINTQDGYIRDNQSWVLGRLLRDFEKPCDRGLRVVVFKALPPKMKVDWIWLSGIVTMLIQLALSIIPFALYGNYSILLVTLSGTFLALCHGALPQWRAEKWKARDHSKKIIAITRGNGSQNVMVILCDGVGLDLEDLASGRVPEVPYTRSISVLLAVLWLVLLITVEGITNDPWYFLGVGLVGMGQNVIAAGAPRTMAAHGIPLEEVETFQFPKVMKVLQEVETKYPHVGESLLGVFFPGQLWPNEVAWWEEAKVTAARKDAERKAEKKRLEAEKQAAKGETQESNA